MWDLDCEESWALKIDALVLEKTLESPLDCKEIQPVHSKWDQSWVFIGRTDAKAETPILWPPDTKSWLIGKDLDSGKDWRQEEKGRIEDEMAGWHHWLNGHGFEQTSGEDGLNRENWHAAVPELTNSQTLLYNWTRCVSLNEGKESLSRPKGEEFFQGA